MTGVSSTVVRERTGLRPDPKILEDLNKTP